MCEDSNCLDCHPDCSRRCPAERARLRQIPRSLRHENASQIIVLAEVEISSILFIIAFVTGAIWMIGEHALFWLGMETNVLTDHRDKLGVVYLLSVTALLIVTFERDEPDSHRLLKKRRRRASDVFSGRHHMNRNAGGRHGRSKGRRGRMELGDHPVERPRTCTPPLDSHSRLKAARVIAFSKLLAKP